MLISMIVQYTIENFLDKEQQKASEEYAQGQTTLATISALFEDDTNQSAALEALRLLRRDLVGDIHRLELMQQLLSRQRALLRDSYVSGLAGIFRQVVDEVDNE